MCQDAFTNFQSPSASSPKDRPALSLSNSLLSSRSSLFLLSLSSFPRPATFGGAVFVRSPSAASPASFALRGAMRVKGVLFHKQEVHRLCEGCDDKRRGEKRGDVKKGASGGL